MYWLVSPIFETFKNRWKELLRSSCLNKVTSWKSITLLKMSSLKKIKDGFCLDYRHFTITFLKFPGHFSLSPSEILHGTTIQTWIANIAVLETVESYSLQVSYINLWLVFCWDEMKPFTKTIIRLVPKKTLTSFLKKSFLLFAF